MRRATFRDLAVALAVLGLAGGSTAQQATAERSAGVARVSAVPIHDERDFPASPARIYEALLDSREFAAFSGRPAEISRDAGGAFSLFGGHIVGRNVELIPNRRIVQAWRVVTWPDGVYSIVTFELKAQGSGTRLTFDHVGFPDGLKDHLAEGWESNYWAPLKKLR